MRRMYPSVRPKINILVMNEARDGYEIVLDPHDIGDETDPMMSLNFRCKIV